MALGTTNISTDVVGTTLGTSSRDVGTLCKHSAVNKWSKWKPIVSNKTAGITDADMEAAGSGIIRANELSTPWEFEYVRPRGVYTGVTEPFRLGDFRNYNHQAGSPVQIQIISVSSNIFSTQTIPPFVMVSGLNYTINFKLILAGEIDPLTINPNTNRTKNTDTEGGYGGLTWVTNPHGEWGNHVYRTPAQVFTCPTISELSQSITVMSSYIRLQYCKYLGDIDGRYEVLHGLWAETENEWDKFVVRSLNTSLRFHTNTNLNIFYSSMNSAVYTNLIAANNEQFGISQTRVRCVYTVNGGGNLTTSTSDFSMPANSEVGKTLTLGGWTEGQDNTFYVRAFLEMYNNDTGTWHEVGYDVFTKIINIPIQQ